MNTIILISNNNKIRLSILRKICKTNCILEMIYCKFKVQFYKKKIKVHYKNYRQIFQKLKNLFTKIYHLLFALVVLVVSNFNI